MGRRPRGLWGRWKRSVVSAAGGAREAVEARAEDSRVTEGALEERSWAGHGHCGQPLPSPSSPVPWLHPRTRTCGGPSPPGCLVAAALRLLGSPESGRSLGIMPAPGASRSMVRTPSSLAPDWDTHRGVACTVPRATGVAEPRLPCVGLPGTILTASSLSWFPWEHSLMALRERLPAAASGGPAP